MGKSQKYIYIVMGVCVGLCVQKTSFICLEEIKEDCGTRDLFMCIHKRALKNFPSNTNNNNNIKGIPP